MNAKAKIAVLVSALAATAATTALPAAAAASTTPSGGCNNQSVLEMLKSVVLGIFGVTGSACEPPN
jgi:hypothetical protein